MLGQIGITPLNESWAAYGTRTFEQPDKEDTSLLWESKLDLWGRAAAKKGACYLKYE